MVTRMSKLIADLSSRNKDRRRIAAERLGRLKDTNAIAPLIEASGRGGGERARHAAVRALAEIGVPSVRPLVDTLLNERERILRRASAAEALGLIGGKTVLKPLLHAVKDPSVNVRLHAVVSLARLKDGRAIPYLVKALSDESGGVRVNAASALGIFRSRGAVVPLVKALKEKKWYVRQQAARSLGLIGDIRAAEGLRSAMRDPRPAVAKAARESLEKLAGKEARKRV